MKRLNHLLVAGLVLSIALTLVPLTKHARG